ncbi:MAG: EamA family transporter [Opitutaceae bacterium]
MSAGTSPRGAPSAKPLPPPPVSSAEASRGALWLAFAAIYLIWGSTYLGIRVAIETIPPFAMTALRFLVAGPILLAIVKAQGTPWPTWAQVRHNTAVGIFLLVGGNGLVAWAEQHVNSGMTALIIGISPLFMVLIEWAWPGGRGPTGLTVAGLVLGFVGVAWLVAPWESSATGGLHLGGVVAILGSCFCWCFGSIYSRHLRNPASPLMSSSVQMIGGGLGLALVAVWHGDWSRFDVHAVSARSAGAFAYLVVIGSLVAFSTFVWLLKNSTPARVSTYAFVNPVVAVILGWYLAEEPVNGRTVISATLIVAAVVIITLQKAVAASPAPPSSKANP